MGTKSIILPETSEEMIKSDPNAPGKLDASNGISSSNHSHDLKYYAFLNNFISEKFAQNEKRYFIPNAKVSIYTSSKTFISYYCDLYAYWEFPDFESDLKKSGYYKLKAKLDRDYENKTGYWEVEEKSKI